MKSLEWKDSYSVGVKALDEQHQILLNHLNTIYQLFDDPSQKERIGVLLSELEDYALVHFKTEEDLFAKHRYHSQEQQAKEHRLYEQKISDFRARFDSSDQKVTVDMLEFLADWLTGHILGSDHEYKRYLNNSGVF